MHCNYLNREMNTFPFTGTVGHDIILLVHILHILALILNCIFYCLLSRVYFTTIFQVYILPLTHNLFQKKGKNWYQNMEKCVCLPGIKIVIVKVRWLLSNLSAKLHPNTCLGFGCCSKLFFDFPQTPISHFLSWMCGQNFHQSF